MYLYYNSVSGGQVVSSVLGNCIVLTHCPGTLWTVKPWPCSVFVLVCVCICVVAYISFVFIVFFFKFMYHVLISHGHKTLSTDRAWLCAALQVCMCIWIYWSCSSQQYVLDSLKGLTLLLYVVVSWFEFVFLCNVYYIYFWYSHEPHPRVSV